MKKTLIWVLACCAIWAQNPSRSFAAVGDQRVAYKDLPPAVKKAVKNEKEEIKRIYEFTFNGRRVYEVQLSEKGPDKYVYVSEDGTKIKDTALKTERLSHRRELKLSDLPKPVQATFRTETGSNAKLGDINVATVNGKSVYDIEYSKSGKTSELSINQDGTIAQQDERYSAASDRVSVRGRDSRDLKSDRSDVAGFDRPLSAASKVPFENIPEAVKHTVRDAAGSNPILDTERGTLDGRSVYEIAFKSGGKHNEIRVAEDGSIIQRIAASEIRLPGTLNVSELPTPVRRAIREQVGTGEINDVDKMTVNGKTVYEVGFKHQGGGEQHEVRIAEDGTVLNEPAGAGRK